MSDVTKELLDEAREAARCVLKMHSDIISHCNKKYDARLAIGAGVFLQWPWLAPEGKEREYWTESSRRFYSGELGKHKEKP